MSTRSDLEIKKWSEFKKNYETGKWRGGALRFQQRLGAYKGSLVLGRAFLESNESYLKRKGLKEFWDYHF
jgi:hypothetical protein